MQRSSQLAYLVALAGVLITGLSSVRVGAIVIAAALGLFMLPNIKKMRTIEKIIPVAIFVSLITIALALPRG
jgi:uncharacterized BrkB/YihY/UPF0761 family membrane protein